MSLSVNDFIYPVFVKEGIVEKERIDSLPGQFRYGVGELDVLAETLNGKGIGKVLLFGVPNIRDEAATSAFDERGIIQESIRILKKYGLTVLADVCLCQYTSHGECRILTNGKINEDKTRETLGKIAASYAQAGADYVAPSAVLAGQVKAIRGALDDAGFMETKIMSYSAKFASFFYAPFRDAVESTYQGGVRSYQLDCGDREGAIARIIDEVSEGADSVVIKPAMPYLDVIYEAKKRVKVPVAAYQVSGEYTSLKSLNDSRVIVESLKSIKRAGADYIITYAALDVAGEL